jgi:pimeloyl-ACP methyl ester carboxylesterase
MKRCPQCNRVETDDTLGYCRADGTALISDSGPVRTEAGTVKFVSASVSSEIETSVLPRTITNANINQRIAPTTVLPAQHAQENTRELSQPKRRNAIVAIAAVIAIALIAGVYIYWPRGNNTAQIESIAVNAPASAPDPYATIAKRVSTIPIWIFHGDADQFVSVEESRRMAAAFKGIGANVQYTELPGVDHNAWDPAYERADLVEWMFKQRRH